MSDKASTPAALEAAGASSSAPAATTGAAGGASSTTAKKPLPEGNPAFRMMGLPRMRLPSRNWMIFLGITGSFASAVIYDKWQTGRVRDKWCKLVSHTAEEPLDTKSLPRKLTIYLAAPPGDGLRSAREHFHNYIKPVLVAAAMDWDVVEGRKEGDVRFKTAERIRRKRRRGGEGEPLAPEDYSVDTVRTKNGTSEAAGVAGDLIVGRHTWKEYVRGLHEGWLGPVTEPADPVQTDGPEDIKPVHSSVTESLGDAAVKAAANVAASKEASSNVETLPEMLEGADASSEATSTDEKPKEETNEEDEEKPKRRHPPAYILPSDYHSATASSLIPEYVGPSAPIQFPHLLGIRNTPIRIYRFLTRRRLADDVGRQVASAILANHRPYNTMAVVDEIAPTADASSASAEQTGVLSHEEQDWWKTVRQPRKEHEESVWIEEITLDERLTSRMRRFELSAEDGARAERIADGSEPSQTSKKSD